MMQRVWRKMKARCNIHRDTTDYAALGTDGIPTEFSEVEHGHLKTIKSAEDGCDPNASAPASTIASVSDANQGSLMQKVEEISKRLSRIEESLVDKGRTGAKCEST